MKIGADIETPDVDGNGGVNYSLRLDAGQRATFNFSVSPLAAAAGKIIENGGSGTDIAWKSSTWAPNSAKPTSVTITPSLDANKNTSTGYSNIVKNEVYGPGEAMYYTPGVRPASTSAFTLTKDPAGSWGYKDPVRVFDRYTLLNALTTSASGWKFSGWYQETVDDKGSNGKALSLNDAMENQQNFAAWFAQDPNHGKSTIAEIAKVNQHRLAFYGWWEAPVDITLTAEDNGYRHQSTQTSLVDTTESHKDENVAADEKAREDDIITYTVSYTNTNNQVEDGMLKIVLPTADDYNSTTAEVEVLDGAATNAAFSNLKPGATASYSVKVRVKSTGLHFRDAEPTIKVKASVDYTPKISEMTHAAGTLLTEQTQVVENPLRIAYDYADGSVTPTSGENYYTESTGNSIAHIYDVDGTMKGAIDLPSPIVKGYYYGDNVPLYSGYQIVWANKNNGTDDRYKLAPYYWWANKERTGNRFKMLYDCRDNATVYVYWHDALYESIEGW